MFYTYPIECTNEVSQTFPNDEKIKNFNIQVFYGSRLLNVYQQNNLFSFSFRHQEGDVRPEREPGLCESAGEP